MAEPSVPLGEIVTTHGLRGWLKLNPFNRETTAIAPGAEVVLKKDSAESSARKIEASQPHRNQWLVKLKDIDHIDDAAKWVGWTLFVAETALEDLKPGEYYHYQVIGFDVFSATGERIGVISSILSTAGGELYVIQGDDREHLIPAVKEFIEKVDFTAGKVIIDPPPGLLDL
jgi:16S rRNA processing protein RimM